MNFFKVPPFKDAHVHFVVDGKPISDEGIISIGKEFQKMGIFEVRDMGFSTAEGFRAKRLIGDKIKIKTCGYALYKKGTYGVFLGKGIDNVKEARDLVSQIIKEGADFIKVVNSGIVSLKSKNYISPGGFTFEELKIICQEAKNKGLEIVCHVNGDKAIRDAIKAGVVSIEHGYFASMETLQEMKEKLVSWTPTVFSLWQYSILLKDDEKNILQRIIDNHLKSINYASTIGVKINIGTDSGSRHVKHGESFFDELRLLKQSGIDLQKILSYACMDEEDYTGKYLLLKEDFIDTREVQITSVTPKSAIEVKSLIKSASKIGRAGEGFLYDTL